MGIAPAPLRLTIPSQAPLDSSLGIEMNVWIQHADFSEDEFDLDLASTLRKFEDVDWLAELAMEENLKKSGDDSCPPGLGIDHPEKRILHICPSPSGALVHFHFPQKVMGMFSRQKSVTFQNVPSDRVKRFIQAFFAQDWKVIEHYT